MTHPKRVLPRKRALPALALGVITLAACLHAPAVAPTQTLNLSGPDSATARTRGPFAVVYAAPRGKVTSRLEPGITVMFSRSMRAVETPDDGTVPPLTVQTAAGPVAGTWRWTGTRGLLFTPKDDLPGGSDFVVTVPVGTRSLDGAELQFPYTLTFQTDGPRVLEVTPEGRAGITPRALPSDPAFLVDIDQPVDPVTLEAASTLRVFGADGDHGESVRMQATIAKPSEAAKAAHGVTIRLKPEKALPVDRGVELTIAESLRGTAGPRPMEAKVTRDMRTHGPLSLVDFYCARISKNGRCRAGGDVKVTFSTPVAVSELRAHLRGLPPPRALAKGEKRGAKADLDHWLWVDPKLGEEYSVTITAGMRDIYGQKLAKDAAFTIDVEAPLTKPSQPAAEATTQPPTAPIPVIPPPAPGDTRPRRAALPYQLDLGVAGEVLEADGPHRIPVGAINIPTYASLAAGLGEDQAVTWLLARDSEFLTRNSLTPTWTQTRSLVNEREVNFLDLDAALTRQHGRGPALLVLRSPSGETDVSSLVTLTDLGVTAKMGPYGGLVWVTHLSSGKPAAGAKVVFRTTRQNVAFEGATDKDGLLIVPIEKFDATVTGKSNLNAGTVRSDTVIIVHDGNDWSVTKLQRAQTEARLTPEFSSLSKKGQWAGMIFADHGVFRPGEKARVSGIVRVEDTAGLRSIPGRELRIELKDRSGEQLFDGRATCDDFGTFSLEVPVPKNAGLGGATLTATAAAGGKSNTFQPGVFSNTIRILAYTPDEFKVTAEADKPFYIHGDKATFTTTGAYLYGAPMPGATVTSQVTRQEVPFTPPDLAGFTTDDDEGTIDIPETTKAAEAVDSDNDKLDEKGRAVREVDLSFADQRHPERVFFDVDVQDLSRRTVSSRIGVVLHPAEFYVALRTPEDRFATVGLPYHGDLLAVEPNGTHRRGAKVTLDLVERKWNAVVAEQPGGTPTRKSEAVDTVVSSCTTVSAEKATGCDVRFPHAGYFILRATAKDPRGNTVRSSTGIYGTDKNPQRNVAAWSADDGNVVKLELNKAAYAPGETAKVLVRNPFQEAEALVTVERNGILWQKVIPIAGALPVVAIPVLPEFYPNAFVSVVALRGRIAPAKEMGTDLGGPAFRMGYVELNVDPAAHRLHVAISEPKTEYQPGDVVSSDVAVIGADGKPARSVLTFYAVDEGVLALTSYKTPDPLPAFVNGRKLGVFAFENRELLGRILTMKAGERVRSLGLEFGVGYNYGYDKGHAAGDGEAAKRANFRTTAFFEAGRKTDENGRAHFEFKLPDNLTTFRIMAVAAAADDRFGSGESTVTTFRRLMARPALPRFIRTGDKLEASVIIASKAETGARASTAPMEVSVRLEAKGVELDGDHTRTITMARGSQSEVRFKVHATTPGEATLKFTARGGGDEDVVEMKRKVSLPTSAESVAVYGETDGAVAIALGDTRLMRPDRGGLDVHMASTALVGLDGALEHLVDYPYACTEQLSSRVLPLLALLDPENPLGLKTKSDSGAIIDAAIEAMLKRQAVGGGFRYWDSGPTDPWLSGYAMLALSGASERKRFVPANTLSEGRSYLSMRLASYTREFGKKSDDDGEHEASDTAAHGSADDPDNGDGSGDGNDDNGTRANSDDAPHRNAAAKTQADTEVDFETAAFIGDVLASTGSPNPAALNILFDVRAGMRLFGQASLLHAMSRAQMSAPQLKTLTQEIEGRLRIGANEVVVAEEENDRFGALLDSPARTLAATLRAFIAVDPHHPLAARMARSLLAVREAGGWRTTQEDAWALLALADYRKTETTKASELIGRAFLRGGSLLSKTFSKGGLEEARILVPAAQLVGASGGDLTFQASGGGKLFYAAELKYDTALLPAKPRDEGLFVQRYIRGVAPTALQQALATVPQRSSETVNAGDLVLVDLLFESAEPRNQVVLDDPLPAGLEGLDYELDTVSEAKKDAEAKSAAKGGSWLGTTYRTALSHREMRDDRVVTFFDRIEPGMYRVTYLARATSVGTFVTPPTRIEAMYSPEVYGRTAATTLAVRSNP